MRGSLYGSPFLLHEFDPLDEGSSRKLLEKTDSRKMFRSNCRWWFHFFFNSRAYLGKIPILTNMFRWVEANITNFVGTSRRLFRLWVLGGGNSEKASLFREHRATHTHTHTENTRKNDRQKINSRWWFQLFVFFHPYLGR